MAYDSCLNLDNCVIADQSIPSCFDGVLLPGYVDATEAGGVGAPVMVVFEKVNGSKRTIETTIDGTGQIGAGLGVDFSQINEGDWVSEAGGALVMRCQKADYSYLDLYDGVKTPTSIGRECVSLTTSDQDEIAGVIAIQLTWD